MKYDIFVSYRRSDRELVASVVRRLEARGVGVWYDAEIEGGADWRETIVEALTNSDMLAIFFSEDCNNSRQLKKELAIADHLGKPVVPILIEDTQPRGAYLYELADRNWIQMFPEPMDRIEELVEHLVTLAGKDGFSGGKVAANDTGDVKKKSAAPAPLGGAPAAPAEAAAAAPAPEAEQPLAEAVEEFISGADKSTRPAPKIAKAYVGRAGAGGKPIRKLNDILPFKWIDVAVLGPLLVVWAFFLDTVLYGLPLDSLEITATALIMIATTAAYGALVFPIRYYLRRRPPLQALGSYLLSSAILYAVFAVAYLAMRFGTDVFQGEDAAQTMLIFAVIWGGLTVVAFLIYGVLAGQRAIRSFRSNIRKI